MKIILDESVPQKPRVLVEGGRSVAGRGGTSGLRFVHHGGSRLSYQQNLTGRKMALIPLSTNNWSFIKAHIGAIMAAVDAVKPGSCTEVEILLG
jgi:hypothetical protein